MRGRKWEEAKKVIKLYSERPNTYEVPARLNREIFDEYYEKLGSVEIPLVVQEALANFVATLIEDYGCNETNSLISDRTFFVKSLKIMRAYALLHDRDTCTVEDLNALKFMTAFRIPEEVFQQLDQILEDLTSKKKKKTGTDKMS